MLERTLRFLKNRTGLIPSINKLSCQSFSTNIRGGITGGDQVAQEKVDCVVIGAGIVGIAAARELSLRGRYVLVLESASTFGTATSSRNSEVIHAGIYYPPNSLKVLSPMSNSPLLYWSDGFLT